MKRDRPKDDYMTYTRPEEIKFAAAPVKWAQGVWKEQVKSGLLGLAVADALGVPVEFSSRRQLKEHPVKTMMGYGTWNQPPGTWSDDSSMAFCLAESLCMGYDLEDLGQRFVDWVGRGYWTPHGVVFDIGNATASAIARLKQGVKPSEAGGKTESDNGNGSLMRILPLAFTLMNVSDDQRKWEMIHEVSAVTHAHPRSLIGCAIYIEMALQLLRGETPRSAYEKMKGVISQAYAKSPYANELSNYSRVLEGDIAALPEAEIQSSGYVVHTLEAALWCLLKNHSYEETVLQAVNLGEDTDTVGAVAGGLAGIYHGFRSIPEKWLEVIAKREEIIELCERFGASFEQ